MIGQSKAAALVAASSLLLVNLALAGSTPILPRQVETTPPDCTKLGTNGTIYTGLKENFEILCGYDFPGGDYAAMQADTFEDCIKACEDDATCSDVAYGFGSHGCYLKDTAAAATTNSGIYAARKIPNADAPISCKDPAHHNTTYSHGTESQYQILCDTDFAGGDLAAIAAETFADCIAACDANDECVDVSYGFRTTTCWLKGTITTPNSAEGIWTARKKTEEETGPKTVVTCENNASNNTVYKSGASSFLVLCGFDYGGGDMGGSPQPTFADCMDACATAEGCVDVSYAGGFCYMKNTLTTLSLAGWVWTGKKVVDTTVPVPTGSDLTCLEGAWDGKNFTTSSGNQYAIICGREYPGGDLKGVGAATFEDCVDACDATEGCIDVSYVAPACYLKSSLTALQDAGYVSTALFVGRPTVADPVVPLSCVDNKDNGTKYATPAGNEYVILCGVDYFGGDMNMVYTDTFEKCIDACDHNDGCIDVAYSGTACYMKDKLVGDSPTPAEWVWNARYVGQATPTSSTSSGPASTGTATETSATETSSAIETSATETSETPCSTEAAGKFIPSQDMDIDRSSPERFIPALKVELNYAEQPGTRVLQMELELSTAATLLENMAQVSSVTCTESSVLVTFPSVSDFSDDVVTGWADKSPLLITYFEGCNIETARGFWATTSYTFSTAPARSILFAATQVNLTDVATEATLKYGTIDSGVESYSSTTVGAAAQPTAAGEQTCAASSTVDTSATTTASETSPASTGTAEASSTTASETSATATPSDRPLPGTLEDLTPAARELYDFIMARLPVDADGNLNYNVPPQKVTELEVAPYDPDNVGKQQELEDMFQNAGLDSPADLVAKASTGLQGVCEAPAATVQRRLLQPSRRIQREIRARSQVRSYADSVYSRLKARDDGWDVACDDLVTGLLGIVRLGDAMEAVCAGKSRKSNPPLSFLFFLEFFSLLPQRRLLTSVCVSVYDNRDAFKCLFGGCQTTTYIVTKTTTYDFNYAWKIDFPNIQSWLTKTGNNKLISCVNCGFAVSNIAFSGKIVVSVTEGVLTIKSADVTPGISGTANMVVRLQSDGAYSGDWSYNFNTVDLGAIQMDSAFKITPTVIYGLGVQFSTDSALDVTGGASFSWNGAAAPINIMSRSLTNKWNWQPTVSLTMPSFKTGATVSIKPYMRWLVNLNVDIYGMVKILPSITSQTVIGIESKYSFDAANGCPANSLKVKHVSQHRQHHRLRRRHGRGAVQRSGRQREPVLHRAGPAALAAGDRVPQGRRRRVLHLVHEVRGAGDRSIRHRDLDRTQHDDVVRYPDGHVHNDHLGGNDNQHRHVRDHNPLRRHHHRHGRRQDTQLRLHQLEARRADGDRGARRQRPGQAPGGRAADHARGLGRDQDLVRVQAGRDGHLDHDPDDDHHGDLGRRDADRHRHQEPKRPAPDLDLHADHVPVPGRQDRDGARHRHPDGLPHARRHVLFQAQGARRVVGRGQVHAVLAVRRLPPGPHRIRVRHLLPDQERADDRIQRRGRVDDAVHAVPVRQPGVLWRGVHAGHAVHVVHADGDVLEGHGPVLQRVPVQDHRLRRH